MKVYYTVEVRDKEGKLLKRLRRRSRSYVRQWNDIICVQMCPSTNRTIKDTGGVNRTTINSDNLGAEPGAGALTRGIIVGIGSTAVSISDYALGTECVEGTGADQLNYLAQTYTAPAVSGSECSFTTTRVANNNSGNTVTVTEIGIYVLAVDSGSTSRIFLGIRDVLASSQAVPDGGAITVVYTLKVTV